MEGAAGGPGCGAAVAVETVRGKRAAAATVKAAARPPHSLFDYFAGAGRSGGNGLAGGFLVHLRVVTRPRPACWGECGVVPAPGRGVLFGPPVAFSGLKTAATV